MSNKSKPRRLSWSQLTVLQLVRDGENPYTGCHGLSEHGGRCCTITSLCRRKLVADNADGECVLTDAGKAQLEALEREAKAAP